MPHNIILLSDFQWINTTSEQKFSVEYTVLKTDNVFLILNLLILCNMKAITQLSIITRCHQENSTPCPRVPHLTEFVSDLKLYSGSLLINSTYSDCISKHTHFCLSPPPHHESVSSPSDEILLISSFFSFTNKMSSMTSHQMICSNPERFDQLHLICLKIYIALHVNNK